MAIIVLVFLRPKWLGRTFICVGFVATSERSQGFRPFGSYLIPSSEMVQESSQTVLNCMLVTGVVVMTADEVQRE